MSVLLYIFLLFWPIFLLFAASSRARRVPLFVYFLAFAPTVVFAALRGNAGTDTEYYRELFDYVDISSIGLDPLFWFFQAVIKAIGLNFFVFTIVFSAFVLYLFCYGLYKIENTRPYFSVSLLPVLLIDGTFNGLRYGLAFALTVYILGTYTARMRMTGLASLLIPSLAHSSMLVLIFLKLKGSIFLIILLAIIIYLLAGNISTDYFVNKFDLYSDLSRPSSFSGLVPIVQGVFFIYIKKRFCEDSLLSKSIERLGFVVLVFSLLLMTQSYAGLRFIQIAVFLLALSIPMSNAVRNPKMAFLVASFVGLLTNMNFLRQIIFSDNEVVKFIPYDFIFNLN